MHSFERKLSALSNAVSGKVVRRISCKLFGLKARGDFFLITLCNGPSSNPNVGTEKKEQEGVRHRRKRRKRRGYRQYIPHQSIVVRSQKER